MDSLQLEENIEGDNTSPTRAIRIEEEEKDDCGEKIHGAGVNIKSDETPGYLLRKTKIGIEISSLEESHA